MNHKPDAVHAMTLEEQHAEIRELIEQLKRRSSRLSDQDEPKAVGSETLAILQKLEALLDDHFALEEKGKYLASALAIAPRLSETAARLLKQHGELLDQLRGIIQRITEAGPSSPAGSTLEKQIDRFADHLRNHDTAENQLVQAAYFDDHGGG